MNSRNNVHQPFSFHAGDDLAIVRQGRSDGSYRTITPQDNHGIVPGCLSRQFPPTGRCPHANHELMGQLAIEYGGSDSFALQARL
jgi:hypothetical protein